MCLGLRIVALLAIFLGAMAAPVSARSPARPVILLSCEAPADLCRVMIQTLAQHSQGFVIRRVPKAENTPRRPGDLGVDLVWSETQATPERPVGTRLEWRSYGAILNHIGPWFHLRAIELPLSENRQGEIARQLVASNAGLQNALRPK